MKKKSVPKIRRSFYIGKVFVDGSPDEDCTIISTTPVEEEQLLLAAFRKYGSKLPEINTRTGSVYCYVPVQDFIDMSEKSEVLWDDEEDEDTV